MIKAEFETKHPHNTNWIRMEYGEYEEPSELIEELKNAGWKQGYKLPPKSEVIFDNNGNRVGFAKTKYNEVTYSKVGSGIFGMWTPAEKKANMLEARKILKNHGIKKVPVIKLSLQDLL
jgi:hypothetical protein